MKLMGSPLIIPGAEPFFYPAGETGCLLIHGFKGSPDCVREMGKHLAGAGITALGIRLRGHGTNIEEMERCHFRDWIATAEEGLGELNRYCRIVIVAGISMGGVISLHLARLYPDRIRGVIAMSTPYDMPLWMKILVPALKHVIRRITPLKSLAARDPAVKVACYHQISLPAAHQLFKLIDLVRADLPRITCPVLLIASRLDRAVGVGNASRIFNALGAEDKEIFWVEHSGHMITLDYDQERVFKRAEIFIKQKAALGHHHKLVKLTESPGKSL